jgi:hypothetical protein
MAMNPKLLRPRRSVVYHPESLAWQSAVVANGGTVSTSTLAAVSTFCKSIAAAGLRDRFIRVNLFCGDKMGSFANCGLLVPLYRGPSSAGTQYGNTVDSASGFATSNYSESQGVTAPSSGAIYFDTGVTVNFSTATNTHFAAYESLVPTGSFKTLIGVDDNLSAGTRSAWWLSHISTTRTDAYVGTTTPLIYNATRAAGFWCVSNQSARRDLFRNGSSVAAVASAQTGVGTDTDSYWSVFSLRRDGVNTDYYYGGRLNGYSLGYALSASQSLAYYNIMQAFQASLGRSV